MDYTLNFPDDKAEAVDNFNMLASQHGFSAIHCLTYYNFGQLKACRDKLLTAIFKNQRYLTRRHSEYHEVWMC